MQNALTGKRVLITQATEFMGPVLCEVFAEQGAEVVASAADLSEPGAARRVVVEATDDEHVLFGTDAPMRDPRQQLGWVLWSDLPEQTRVKILGANFQRILDRVKIGKP